MEPGQGGPGKRDAPRRSPRDQRTGGRGTNGVRPRRPTWQRRGRGTDPTVEVGWPRATVRGPEAIQNDPEAKQLPRHATESHRQKPPAQERSLAPRTSTALPGPHGAPLSRLAPITANTQSHNWSWRTLSGFPLCTSASTALTCNLLCPAITCNLLCPALTCNLLCPSSPLGDREHFSAQRCHQPWRPGKDTT